VQRSKRDEVDRLRISTAQVRRLNARLSQLNLAARRKVTGIGPRRAEIIIPGIAVLLDFLQQFHLPAVYYSRAGVRDGIIADLAARNVGAERSRLSRDQRREVEEMARRYGVPLERARKVAHDANLLFAALQPIHELPPAAGKLLEAAAYLCEIGHYVSSASHHKHSYYVVANSDLAGFTDRERLLIASLCRYHRKSLPSMLHSAYQILTVEEKRTLMQLIPIIRLADNLDRSQDQRILGVDMRTRDGEVVLQVHSSGDLDLEQWRAERAGEAFRQIYNRNVTVAKAKD
jgi:exopolyphosphatase/guanosine-5'-triphosphate,3'-diphosphate pyrophosphatase